MRFVILTRFHSQHAQGEFILHLAAAAAEAGDTITIVNPADIFLDFSKAPAPGRGSGNLQECPVRWRDLAFPAADLILPLARWDDEFTWQVADTLSAWGQPVYPSSRVPLGDHVTMARLFARGGVPSPRSWVLSQPEQLTVILPELNFPCVLRGRHGGKGRQFSVARHSGEALELASRFSSTGQPFLVQDLPQPWGEDLRILVLGNSVAAAVRRIAPAGFIRPRESGNLSAERVELTEAETALAKRAAHIYSAPFCAVSLLRAPSGPLLLEVARAPVLAELEAATGLNLAGVIVTHLQALAAAHNAPAAPVVAFPSRGQQS